MTLDATVLAGVVSVISVSFSVYMGIKNQKRTDEKDVVERTRENTKINMKLDEIVSMTKEVRSDVSSLKDEMQAHNDRIIKVEESTKQAHYRLNTLEQRLNSLRQTGKEEIGL